MQNKGIIIQVYGKVQGVGFRYYTEKKALELDIKGFVKNRPDGSVYIEAEGKTENLELFTQWCEQGPDWARVLKTEKQNIPLQGFSGFEIR
ncbi:MAG: acylphosphatase [Bacteroidales bacterium]|nr:acylphosphatase [Bacteroidales bacterium]